MAKKSVPQPRPANLSDVQMRDAIPKLRRRLEELNSLDIRRLEETSYRNILNSLLIKYNATLTEIFDTDTMEYTEYIIYSLDRSTLTMGMGRRPVSYYLPGIERGVGRAISKLETLIELFEERLGGFGQTSDTRALRAYQELELHTEIGRAVSGLYQSGHYANAVEASVKALNNFVRLRSGENLDGTPLMQKVFSSKAPLLKFSKLEIQSDIDEQQGFQYLFAGAVMGLRNPRAHGFIQDDAERALEFIAFVSLLAKLLDEAEPA